MPGFSRFRPHPWHGVSIGPDAPRVVNAYVEITPFSTIKYEVDKETGYLRVDRPQRSSSSPPTPYGFIPQTWCGPRIAACAGTPKGDGDPLDICVISERPISQADIFLWARPVGGLLMVDAGEADDKIIAVLDRDPIWSAVGDLGELPSALVDRLRHYFLTYKLDPDGGQPVRIEAIYGVARAAEVIAAASADWTEHYGAA